MKKIIATLLSTALFATSVAGAMTRDYFMEAAGLRGLEDLVPGKINLEVPADIMVKKTDEDDYRQGVIAITQKASADFPDFDFKAFLDMENVRKLYKDYLSKGLQLVAAGAPEDRDLLDATEVTGEFVIEVKLDRALNILNEGNDAVFTTGEEGIDFDDTVFKEVSREYTLTGSTKNVKIVVEVKDPTDGSAVTCKELEDNLDKYLPDLYLECTGIKTTKFGVFDVLGTVTGYTKIGDVTYPISTVTYNAVQKSGLNSSDVKGLKERVAVHKKGSSSDGGSSGGSISIIPQPTVTVVFNVNGDTTKVDSVTGKGGVTVDIKGTAAPDLPGLKFMGWYLDPEFSTKAEDVLVVNKDTIVYAKYVITGGVDVFDSADHKLYIHGYPDGTVQPNGNITREEVATALYRLLNDSVKSNITTTENSFSDMSADRWSNTEVSSMAKAGYVKGYEDGTFRPGNPITRAEFATMALRFFEVAEKEKEGIPFIDCLGHWAESNIVAATKKYIISGYEDGTFRPDKYITRAEAMTIINRITVRHTDADGLITGFIDWPDITKTDWYYYDVLEATNSHAFVRRADNYTENWTSLLNK